MKTVQKKALAFALVVVMLISVCPAAFAVGEQHDAPQTGGGIVVFSDISQMAPGESRQYAVSNPDGQEAFVGIERVQGYARAGGETWRVWYKGLYSNVEFYMTVSNNKVTSAYNYSISLLGSSYEDADLTHTATYGMLTFTHKLLGGLGASTCWLKGEVTGEEDEINVTWQM